MGCSGSKPDKDVAASTSTPPPAPVLNTSPKPAESVIENKLVEISKPKEEAKVPDTVVTSSIPEEEPAVSSSSSALVSSPVETFEPEAAPETFIEKAPADELPIEVNTTVEITVPEEKLAEEPKIPIEETIAVVDPDPAPSPAIVATPDAVEQTKPAPSNPVPTPEAKASGYPTLMQGFIEKEGQFMKSWNKRYFVLNNGELIYYEKPHNLPPYGLNKKGSVPTLKGKTVEVDELNIKIVGGEARDILLRFQDKNTLNGWAIALKEHIAYCNRM